MAADTHLCPGGCGGQVSRAKLSCRPCWFRLPPLLRDEVTAAYKVRWTAVDGRLRHAQALAAASRWYRDNPLPEENP